jgi:non-heme chloroperoxidase
MDRVGPRVRFGRVRLRNGPQLHCAQQGEPGAEAILFLHGWPDSWFSFSRVLALLPPHYHALAVDQRGFGDSEHPPSGYAIDDLARDAADFLDAVAIERATVVGHSLGSFIARRLAVAHPERLARLVLIGSGAASSNQGTRAVQASLRGLPDPVPAEFAREFQASTVCAPVPPEFFERVVAESLKLPARLWGTVLDGLLAFNDADELGRIVAPTLLLWGERDGLFSRDDQSRLEAAIPGARLRIYPETGHCPNWERPAEVVQDLHAFMRET